MKVKSLDLIPKLFLNTGMNAIASTSGKTYKSLGELLELKPIINNTMDLGISQSFRPVIE
jgi:hypothetical protein